MFGFKTIDIEVLSISKLGDDLNANQLIANAQVRQSMMQPAAHHKMIINCVPSNNNSRTSRQPKPDNVILTQRGEDLFVIGSIEKTFMKPPSDARRAFETLRAPHMSSRMEHDNMFGRNMLSCCKHDNMFHP